MEYWLYLKYDASMGLGLHEHCGDLCEHNWANIMYWTKNTDATEEYDEEGKKIGFISWVNYNQALAMVHGINMTHIRFFFLLKGKREALFDLDHTRISQETIDEIGAASNPNFVLLIHFGIEANFRNKRIGEEVMKGFIEQMKGKCGYIIIVNNEPEQFDSNNSPDCLYAKQGITLDNLEKDPEKAQYKLNAFWQRCGFKQFKNYHNVFICNVDQAVPDKARMPAL